jgi:hypothetical protein
MRHLLSFFSITTESTWLLPAQHDGVSGLDALDFRRQRKFHIFFEATAKIANTGANCSNP